MIVLIDGVRYHLVTPSEAWLEKAIQSNCKHIFGPDSFYFDIKKLIRSKAGVASIPDGYVIFFTPKPQWAIIEVELASHPVYKHLIPQLTKFNRGIEGNTTRSQLIKILYGIFNEDEVLKAMLKRKIKTGEDVHKFISDLVSEKPLIVVVIDQKTEELKEALKDIRGGVEVVEFKTFRREGVSEDVNAFVFEPLSTKLIIIRPDEYSEFWEPIRREGLFMGRPVPIRDEGWIAKGVRGISVELILQDHKCLVQVSCKGEGRLRRRKKIMQLFPQSKYEYKIHESPKSARIRFPVLDKGKKERDHWPEMREKLTKLGTDIYNKIRESGV